MDIKPGKRWFRSRTIWAGIGSVGVGIFTILKGDAVNGILTITTGLGAIFGRATATKEITTKKTEAKGVVKCMPLRILA